MKIRPLHDRVIVKRLEEERKTASGIVIHDAAAEKPALKHTHCKLCKNKHYAKGYCAKHYWLYVTKPKLKTKK